MTLPRLAELSAYWKKHPPTHIIAAALAGIKTPPSEAGEKINKGGLPDFVNLPDVEE